MIKEKYQAIYYAIESNVNTDNMIILWNHFCDDCYMRDDIVESIDSFNEVMYGKDPLDIAEMISFGKFNANDDYFCFNGYGNLVTFNYWSDDDSPIYLSEDFIEFIEENFQEHEDILDFLLDDEDIKDEFVAYVNGKCNTDFSYDEICEKLEDTYEFDNVIEDDWEHIAEELVSCVENS